jgi:hypothetical protein
MAAVMTSPVPQWNRVQWSCGASSFTSRRAVPAASKRIGTQHAPEIHDIAHTEGTIIVQIKTNYSAEWSAASAAFVASRCTGFHLFGQRSE